MREKICVTGLTLLMLVFICRTAYSEEQIQITRDDATNYRILVAQGASPVEVFAAQELQGYLMQISNVFLPMVRGDVRRGEGLILVGKGAAEMLRLEPDEGDLAQDDFVIKTSGSMIILAGGSPRGTLYSVYAFLKTLGCRWLTPGILGEVVPRRPDIVIPVINSLEHPGIAYRGFTNLSPVPYEGVQWIDWMAKNRLNYLVIPQSNYADIKQILGGELEKRGMDTGVSFDSLTPADQILEFIADNPEVDTISFYKESLSSAEIEQMLSIREQYPDKLVLLTQPDQIAPVLNGIEEHGPGRCYRHSLDDRKCEINNRIRSYLESRFGAWNRTQIHEYYMGPYSQNSLLFPVLHTIGQDLRYLSKLEGVDGVISQCEPGNWGAYGLNYYIFARMAWNPGDDVTNIIHDYCEKYYGSTAGEPMERYFTILEDAMTAMEHFRYVDPPQLILELLSETSLVQMELEIQNAKQMAKDAMIFDRIRKTELSLEHTRLLWHMLDHYSRAMQLQDAGESKKAIEHFQQSADLGDELVAFLFQNIDEGIYVIPEDYIFDYLELFIAAARDRRAAIDPKH